jgi:hypothetical protein
MIGICNRAAERPKSREGHKVPRSYKVKSDPHQIGRNIYIARYSCGLTKYHNSSPARPGKRKKKNTRKKEPVRQSQLAGKSEEKLPPRARTRPRETPRRVSDRRQLRPGAKGEPVRGSSALRQPPPTPADPRQRRRPWANDEGPRYSQARTYACS